MSDKELNQMTMQELQQAKRECKVKIRSLNGSLNGQNNKLKWIEKYIDKKNPPKEMTLQEIEARLGHKVSIIKE